MSTETLRAWYKVETKKHLWGLLQLIHEALLGFGKVSLLFLLLSPIVAIFHFFVFQRRRGDFLLQVDLVAIETLSQFVEEQKKDLNEDSGSNFSNFLQIFNIYLLIFDQVSLLCSSNYFIYIIVITRLQPGIIALLVGLFHIIIYIVFISCDRNWTRFCPSSSVPCSNCSTFARRRSSPQRSSIAMARMTMWSSLCTT